MDRLRCGILGATGIIGQRFVQTLTRHPWFELVSLYSTRADGRKSYEGTVNWMLGPDVPASAGDIVLSEYGSILTGRKDIDVVFSALPADTAQKLERKAARKGIHVISNSSCHRMDRDIPLMVPEVNGDHLKLLDGRKDKGILVTNPNCTSVALVMALDPIRDLIEGEVHVSSYQAISGAGYPGVPSLDIYGNVVPFINGEEEKLIEEPGKIMGSLKGGSIRSSPLKVVPNCVRVGVKDGHLVSFSARVVKGTDADDIIKLIGAKKGLKGLPSAPERPLVYRRERDRPRPDLDSFSGDPPGMVVSVGRVRVDDGMLRAFSLVNNTIRGGAGNAVLIAEQCKRGGYL